MDLNVDGRWITVDFTNDGFTVSEVSIGHPEPSGKPPDPSTAASRRILTSETHEGAPHPRPSPN